MSDTKPPPTSPSSPPARKETLPSPKPSLPPPSPEELKKRLERVAKLIRLSASAEEQEARSAALQACRLIRENSFQILTAETVKRVVEVAESARHGGGDPAGVNSAPITVTARQGGECFHCGRSYRRGDRIWVRLGVGAVHTMTCDPYSLM